MQMDYSLPVAPYSALGLLYCMLASLNSPPTVTQTEALTYTHLLLFKLFSHSHSQKQSTGADQIKLTNIHHQTSPLQKGIFKY